MRANHRHYQNVVPVARLILGIAVVLLISSALIYYVWNRNQIDIQGRLITSLERQLTKLQNEHEVVRGQIVRRSSIDTLQQGFDNGLIRLSRITQYEPIYKTTSADGNEVRSVSNPNRTPRP